jgi:NAD(P)-dependent dehydrogenase (short-subunit alcohol dehydrogenase family)
MTAGSTAPLAGKHALVTGAGGGIGRAIVGRLVAAGSRVTLAGRRREALEAVAEGFPAADIHVAAGFDVNDIDAVAAGVAGARAALGQIAILVNCAGEAPSASFERTDAALWDSVIATDLTSVFTVTQAVLSDLKALGSGGRIINVASSAGLKGYRYVSAYCAAKHGVIGLTRALALEFARYGITVNAVCPGFTDTPLIARSVEATAEATGRPAEAVMAELVRTNPQGRLVRPEEVADAVLWLALPSSSAITGQAIAVAGGEL